MKILTTIGPVSNSLVAIKKLGKFTNTFRLNGSHNSIEWHSATIKKIKKINKNNQILFDIPGAPRLLIKKKYPLENQLVYFYYKRKTFDKQVFL